MELSQVSILDYVKYPEKAHVLFIGRDNLGDMGSTV